MGVVPPSHSACIRHWVTPCARTLLAATTAGAASMAAPALRMNVRLLEIVIFSPPLKSGCGSAAVKQFPRIVHAHIA